MVVIHVRICFRPSNLWLFSACLNPSFSDYNILLVCAIDWLVVALHPLYAQLQYLCGAVILDMGCNPLELAPMAQERPR